MCTPYSSHDVNKTVESRTRSPSFYTGFPTICTVFGRVQTGKYRMHRPLYSLHSRSGRLYKEHLAGVQVYKTLVTYFAMTESTDDGRKRDVICI